MNGRVVLLGYLALFSLFALLPILACDMFDDEISEVEIQMTLAPQQTMTAEALPTRLMETRLFSPTLTIPAQWTAQANATLTAAASKEALTSTAVWLGETATIIAHMTEVWGTNTPTATPTPTATLPATATPTASPTSPIPVAGTIELLLDDPAGDVYTCMAGPSEVSALQPFLLDVRQARITSDGQNLILQVSFDEGVGDLGQSVQQTNQLWNMTLAAYDPRDPLPPADPAVYAAALGNFGFATLWLGNQNLARSYDYVNGEWIAETVAEGVAFEFDGNSATMTIAIELMPDEGLFRIEISYNQGADCDEVGSNGGPIVYFVKQSDPNYAFSFEQRDIWTGGP